MARAFRVGIAGPVGSGKTALVDRLCRRLSGHRSLAVVTNDIYTREDAEFLLRQGTLPPERSPDLVDVWIYVIDVAGGDKIPRKGGPGIIRSDLLVINKIDLAPHVGASLEVMERDARRMRGERRFCFTNLRDDIGLDPIVAWLEAEISRPAVERRAILDAHVPHSATSHAHDHNHPHTHHSK